MGSAVRHDDARPAARGGVEKHSVVVAGHATSVSLEPAFWKALGEIAGSRGMSIAGLITEIDRDRRGNLSSAIRLHVLDWLRVPAGGATESS